MITPAANTAFADTGYDGYPKNQCLAPFLQPDHAVFFHTAEKAIPASFHVVACMAR